MTLQTLLQIQLPIIHFVQNLNHPLLIIIYKILTFLCDERFFLVFLPLILWVIDYRLGCKLIFFLLIGVIVNFALKDLGHQPRPFMIDHSIILLQKVVGKYGFPSGHAQLSIMMWGVLAHTIAKRWAWFGMVVLSLAVGLSRIALGAHFPTDVITGWLIGMFLLFLYIKYSESFLKPLTKLNPNFHLLAAIILPILILIARGLSPTSVLVFGALSGFWLGSTIFYKSNITNTYTKTQKMLSFIIGILILFILYIGLAKLFPSTKSSLYLTFRYIRYLIVFLWIAIAPCLFNMIFRTP